MVKEDEAGACCPRYPGAWAWVLTDLRKLRPFPVSGRLGLYEVDLGSGPLVLEPCSPPVLQPTQNHNTRKAEHLRNG